MLHDMPKAPGTCVVSRMHQGCMVEYHVPELANGLRRNRLHLRAFCYCRCMAEQEYVMICHWLACGVVQELSGLQMGQTMCIWSQLQS